MENDIDNEVKNKTHNNKIKLKWYDVAGFTFVVTTWLSIAFVCCFGISISYAYMSIVSLILSALARVIIGNKKTKIFHIVVLFILAIGAVYVAIYIVEDAQAQILGKPIVYLYPEKTEQVNVLLGNPEQLTHTYPKYDERAGWNVTAEPNGNLLHGDKNLYALYWEGKSRFDKKIQDDGFVVKGENTIEFLEEKLRILGLNEREAEEFIVYWLPQMEDNKYNYIRFETREEIDYNMPLDITPKPDTLIRIVMDWCEIDSEAEANELRDSIKEQELITPERTGFVAVEWGGSKIN